jgi:hypothetical protein
MSYEKANIRIRHVQLKGFVVEIQKTKWSLFGLKKYWTHYINEPFNTEKPKYFDRRRSAQREALSRLETELETINRT